MTQSSDPTPEISVVIPTYNRGTQLRPVLAALLAQETGGVTYEVIVVDNNSPDGTRSVVEEAIAADASGLIQYVFEPRQGVSYARNTGVQHSRAPIIGFLDDDGVPTASWVRQIKRAFDVYPQVDCIGGRVRALWTTPRPSWLTAAHAGPVALQDRPHVQWVDRSSASACLITANLAIRRAVFDEIGGFSPDYPRNQDREFEMRMWRAGMLGVYLPTMDVVVEIPPERLTKRYHRKWQATTGRYHALLRFRDTVDASGRLHDEEVKTRRLFGTPLFLYRSFLHHLAGWIGGVLRADGDMRFLHETRLWYFTSFLWTRFKTDALPQLRPGSFRRALVGRTGA
jgi:glycosyltransferase involved in cell wall biosynthesis